MAQDGIPPVDTTTLLEAYLAAAYRVQVEGASLPLRVGEPAPHTFLRGRGSDQILHYVSVAVECCTSQLTYAGPEQK